MKILGLLRHFSLKLLCSKIRDKPGLVFLSEAGQILVHNNIYFQTYKSVLHIAFFTHTLAHIDFGCSRESPVQIVQYIFC